MGYALTYTPRTMVLVDGGGGAATGGASAGAGAYAGAGVLTNNKIM